MNLLSLAVSVFSISLFERYRPGPWHCPCEHHSSQWRRSLGDKHHQPLLWLSHHVTKVTLQRELISLFECLFTLSGLEFFSMMRWTTFRHRTSPTTLESPPAHTTSSGLSSTFSPSLTLASPSDNFLSH